MEFKPMEWIHSFITDAQRVLIVSKKPDTAEYMTMVRITALGLIILGVLGYGVEFITFIIRNTI
ncbi:MAG: protein translocase SEC61 complex subunit gamma [archaeon]